MSRIRNLYCDLHFLTINICLAESCYLAWSRPRQGLARYLTHGCQKTYYLYRSFKWISVLLNRKRKDKDTWIISPRCVPCALCAEYSIWDSFEIQKLIPLFVGVKTPMVPSLKVGPLWLVIIQIVSGAQSAHQWTYQSCHSSSFCHFVRDWFIWRSITLVLLARAKNPKASSITGTARMPLWLVITLNISCAKSA